MPKSKEVQFINEVEKLKELINSPKGNIYKKYLSDLKENLKDELIELKAKSADKFLQKASF